MVSGVANRAPPSAGGVITLPSSLLDGEVD